MVVNLFVNFYAEMVFVFSMIQRGEKVQCSGSVTLSLNKPQPIILAPLPLWPCDVPSSNG